MLKNAYYKNMSERFVGKVVRTERDGFTVIEFDHPIGPSANNYGLISSSTGTTGVPFSKLVPGVKVTGTAESSDHDLASIKSIILK
jgi:hypothetical protein